MASHSSILAWKVRSPGVGNGTSFQYSFLEIPGTEKPGGLQVHRVAKNWTQLRE